MATINKFDRSNSETIFYLFLDKDNQEKYFRKKKVRIFQSEYQAT